MDAERGLSQQSTAPGGEPTRRLTGRPPIPDFKDRIEAALSDPFLRRALPVAQDNMRFRRDEAVEAMGVDTFEALC